MLPPALLAGLLAALPAPASAAPVDLAALLAARSLAGEDELAMTPDGRLAAYVTVGPGAEAEGPPSARIRLIGRGGLVPPDPCPTLGSCWGPSWSPDASRLAYYSDADGAPRLWVFERETGRFSRVSDAPVQARPSAGGPPLWLPDGETFIVPLAAGGFARVRGQSGWAEPLVPASAQPPPGAARLSPTGRWLSYISPRGELAVVLTEGGPPRLIAAGLSAGEEEGPRGAYRWHPAGDRLFFIQYGALLEADLRTGKDGVARKVPGAPSSLLESPLLFSRNGKEVLVALGDPARPGPPKSFAWVSLVEGNARELPVPPEWSSADAVAADEKTAWQPRPGSLTVRARAKDGARILARFEDPQEPPRVLWRGRASISRFANPAHAGGILALYEDPITPPGLFWFDPDMGGKQRLAPVDPALDAFVGAEPKAAACQAPAPGGGMEEARFLVILPPRPAGGPPPPGVVVLAPEKDLSRAGERFPAAARLAGVPLSALTASGYAVILPDSGAGPAEAARLLPQLSEAARRTLVDPARLAVLGPMEEAAALLAKTSAFKAGLAAGEGRGLLPLDALGKALPQAGKATEEEALRRALSYLGERLAAGAKEGP